jgi:HPt (histidine-containing phosphotransfer) domain-containing protein
MNDFVSKPLDPDGFLNTVYRFVGEVAGEGVDGGPAEAGEAPDLDDAQLDGLMKLMPPVRFRAIIEGFLNAAQSRLQRIEACAHSGDMVGMAREAHDLKGVSGNFGARRVQQLADRLEQAARAGGRDEVKSLAREIRRASITAWDLVGRRLAMLGREPDREVA